MKMRVIYQKLLGLALASLQIYLEKGNKNV